jgi:hypothetical protein
VFERSGRIEGGVPASASDAAATQDDLVALAETAFGFLDQSTVQARRRIDKPVKTSLVYSLGESDGQRLFDSEDEQPIPGWP